MKTPVQTSCTTRHVGVNVHIDMHACMQKDNFSCPYCEHYYVCISDMRHCNMLHLGTTELPLSQHVSPFGIAHTHTHVYTDSIYSCTTAQHLERATIFNWYTAAYASMMHIDKAYWHKRQSLGLQTKPSSKGAALYSNRWAHKVNSGHVLLQSCIC